MSGYQCETCNNVFSEPNTRRELDHIDGGTAQYVIVNSCPDCGADDPREVALCIDCTDNGVDTIAVIDDYCREHAIANDMEIDTLEPGQFRRDTVQQ